MTDENRQELGDSGAAEGFEVRRFMGLETN